MEGLMQDWRLTVDKILDHAATWHGTREVVDRPVNGVLPVRSNYGAIRSNAKRLSNALLSHEIRPGDRVATLAFNTHRHLETWYGVMGIGAVCHTLNPRLFKEQLAYIINHAEARLIFADTIAAPMLESLLPQCPNVEAVIWLAPKDQVPGRPSGIAYDDFLAGHGEECRWGEFPETQAAGLCYTSGTTGD